MGSELFCCIPGSCPVQHHGDGLDVRHENGDGVSYGNSKRQNGALSSSVSRSSRKVLLVECYRQTQGHHVKGVP